jgi:hypothetical protein
MRSILAATAIGVVVLNSLGFSAFGQSARGRRSIGNSEQQSVVSAPAAPVSITTLGTPITENFNALSNTAGSTTNTIGLPGWEISEAGNGARDNEQYAVDAGGSTTGDTYSYGAPGSTDRALGSLQSGTLISTYGISFTNNSGATISALNISYTGEQWRIANTAAPRVDQLDFQYSLDATSVTTGTWTDVNALDFINPIQTNTTATALDGNAAANRTNLSSSIGGLNIPNGATFYIRFLDLNSSGADDGLAIDDLSLTALATSAADVSISGRVTDAYGRGIRGVVISVQGFDGIVHTAFTNTFGYYKVAELTAGESYLVSVTARRYTFATPSQVVNLGDSISGFNFTAVR